MTQLHKMPRPATRLSPSLSRRRCIHGVAQSMLILGAFAVGRGATAQGAPATPAADGFTLSFPVGVPLPAGLTLQASGTRQVLGEITGTFRNPRDAAQLLAGWGWQGNVYRSYAAAPGAGPSTPVQLEVSLHRFGTSTGAAYALSYFAHDRAVAIHHHEEMTGLLLPCAAMVLDNGSATQYLRGRNLLVRVTVIMRWPADARASEAARLTATSMAIAILEQAGIGSPARNAFC